MVIIIDSAVATEWSLLLSFVEKSSMYTLHVLYVLYILQVVCILLMFFVFDAVVWMDEYLNYYELSVILEDFARKFLINTEYFNKINSFYKRSSRQFFTSKSTEFFNNRCYYVI